MAEIGEVNNKIVALTGGDGGEGESPDYWISIVEAKCSDYRTRIAECEKDIQEWQDLIDCFNKKIREKETKIEQYKNLYKGASYLLLMLKDDSLGLTSEQKNVLIKKS